MIVVCGDDSADRRLFGHYTNCIAEYAGTGALTFSDGSRIDCPFQAGQLATGDVILICEDIPPGALGDRSLYEEDGGVYPVHFQGATAEEMTLESGDGGFAFYNYLTDLSNTPDSIWAAFRLREVSVRAPRARLARRAVFHLTNLDIFGTERIEGRPLTHRLPIRLRHEGVEHDVTIELIEPQVPKWKRLRALKGTAITCTATMDVSGTADAELVEGVIDGLCHLLAVARGTKIQWIYRDLLDARGWLVSRTHHDRATTPFCPMVTIRPDMLCGEATRAFVEQGYPRYMTGTEEHSRVIDAYVDAKSEGGRLESRGAKLAVAMEALKCVMVRKSAAGLREWIVQKSRYKKVKRRLEEAVDPVLAEEVTDERDRAEIREKIGGLNRRSFQTLLTKLCGHIHLAVSAEDLELFVRSRNSLVHTGRFLCETVEPKERGKHPALASVGHEYFFLVNFLDRVFLKLFGYDGPYVDRSSGRPEWRDNV